MESRYSWDSPSCRLVLSAVLDLLIEGGYDGLTIDEVRRRAGPAGPALDESTDRDELVAAALAGVRLLRPVTPTGCLRTDLQHLLQPWQGGHSRDERVLAAVLSAVDWHPALKPAVVAVLDRPIAQAVGRLLTRAADHRQVPAQQLLTLSWLLRALVVDRLRSGPRAPSDIDRLVDFLLAGVAARTAPQRSAALAAAGGGPARLAHHRRHTHARPRR